MEEDKIRFIVLMLLLLAQIILIGTHHLFSGLYYNLVSVGIFVITLNVISITYFLGIYHRDEKFK